MMTNKDGVTLDPTKPVQTRNGRPARILCTDVEGPRPIIAAVKEDGGERPLVYYPNGRLWESSKSDNDLFNISEKVAVATDEAVMHRLMDEKDRILVEAQRIMGLQDKIIASLTEDNHRLREMVGFEA